LNHRNIGLWIDVEQNRPAAVVETPTIVASHRRRCKQFLDTCSKVGITWRVAGGITALLSIALVPAEVVIGLLPGVEETVTHTVTVVDWFTLFQNHWFLGLRNLGLLNIVGAALLIPTILAIYSVLRRDSEAFAALAAVLFFVGIAVYLAGSRAFPMLSLSRQYASATTDAQRSLLAAAGQAMLAEGESRAGLLLIEFAFLITATVMLRSNVFSRATAGAGMLGSMLMIVLEIAFKVDRHMKRNT
jgi:hypothetical protein